MRPVNSMGDVLIVSEDVISNNYDYLIARTRAHKAPTSALGLIVLEAAFQCGAVRNLRTPAAIDWRTFPPKK